MSAQIPPEAITAAADAIARELMSGKDYSMAIDSDETLAEAALEAAYPLIVADVLARVEQSIAGGAAEVITHAVAAQREADAQLADEVDARYDEQCADSACDIAKPHVGRMRLPFADLLRGQP